MKRKLLLILVIAGVAVGLFVALRNPANEPSQIIPNPVTGLIIQASNESITLRTNDGPEVTFKNQQDVPLDHLIEHQEDDWPVTITWRAEGDKKVATRVDDTD